jgi:hypothetical protein
MQRIWLALAASALFFGVCSAGDDERICVRHIESLPYPPHLHTITYEFEIENRMATSVSFDLPDRVKIVTSFAEIEGQ